MSGYVYFIRCGAYVKIGYSTTPEARKRDLEVGNPEECVMEGLHPGTFMDERRLHRYFNKWHHRGEWFQWCDDIARVATNGMPSLIRGPRTELRLGTFKRIRRGPFEKHNRERPSGNVVAFPIGRGAVPKPIITQTIIEAVRLHLIDAAEARKDHEKGEPMENLGVSLNVVNPHERLAQFLKDCELQQVAEFAFRAGVNVRQAANVLKGRPVATTPYLRLAVAAGFDPMPELPHASVKPSDFDFHFMALAMSIKRRLYGHTERTAARLSGLSLTSIWRIEQAHLISVRNVILACRYLNVHCFGYLNPELATVNHETPTGTPMVSVG